MSVPGFPSVSRTEARAEGRQGWWIFLVTGSAWLLFVLILFRFDYTTATAISVLFGVAMLGGAVAEALNAFRAAGWWRVAYAGLAVAFTVIGIVAFVNPGGTFRALAAVMSFYFVIRGGYDISAAILTRHGFDLWWIQLLVGLVEVVLGFWAAGYFGNRAILLVVWVGAMALARGITDIVLAFSLRSGSAF
jgi:uncharacterized membrane protein HdeD (DUF308 family)